MSLGELQPTDKLLEDAIRHIEKQGHLGSEPCRGCKDRKWEVHLFKQYGARSDAIEVRVLEGTPPHALLIRSQHSVLLLDPTSLRVIWRKDNWR